MTVGWLQPQRKLTVGILRLQLAILEKKMLMTFKSIFFIVGKFGNLVTKSYYLRPSEKRYSAGPSWDVCACLKRLPLLPSKKLFFFSELDLRTLKPGINSKIRLVSKNKNPKIVVDTFFFLAYGSCYWLGVRWSKVPIKCHEKILLTIYKSQVILLVVI